MWLPFGKGHLASNKLGCTNKVAMHIEVAPLYSNWITREEIQAYLYTTKICITSKWMQLVSGRAPVEDNKEKHIELHIYRKVHEQHTVIWTNSQIVVELVYLLHATNIYVEHGIEKGMFHALRMSLKWDPTYALFQAMASYSLFRYHYWVECCCTVARDIHLNDKTSF